jgi:hypothetical protein
MGNAMRVFAAFAALVRGHLVDRSDIRAMVRLEDLEAPSWCMEDPKGIDSYENLNGWDNDTKTVVFSF